MKLCYFHTCCIIVGSCCITCCWSWGLPANIGFDPIIWKPTWYHQVSDYTICHTCNYRWRVWSTLKHWRDEHNFGLTLPTLKSGVSVFDLLFILPWELEIWFLFLQEAIVYNYSIVRFVPGLPSLGLLTLTGALTACRVPVTYSPSAVGSVSSAASNSASLDYQTCLQHNIMMHCISRMYMYAKIANKNLFFLSTERLLP